MREVTSLIAEAGKRNGTRNNAISNYRARILSDVKGGKIAVDKRGLYELSASREKETSSERADAEGGVRRVTPRDSQHLGSGSSIIKVPRDRRRRRGR